MLSVHATAHTLDAIEWDRLAAGNPFATRGWLLTVEASWQAAAQPLYFTLREGGALVAASVCYVCAASPDVETLDDMLLGRAAGACGRLGVSFLPAVVCGPAIGYGWHVGVEPSLERGHADLVRGRMIDAVEAEARRRGLRVHFVQVLDFERDLKRLLEQRGYKRCRHVPVAVLDLEWDSFAAYLQHLSRRTRSEFRRQARKNLAGGTTVALAPTEGIESRLLDLLDRNARKHGGQRFACGPAFFSELAAHMGPEARVFTATKAGAVTAVCVMIVRDRTAIPLAVGVDQAAAGRDFTYFQVTFNELIAHAIDSGIERMFYGRGMYDVKVRRGCRLVDSWIYSGGTTGRGPWTSLWFAVASSWNHCKLPRVARRALPASPEPAG